MKLKYLTNKPSQTRKLGEVLAKEVLKTKPLEKALVIGLEGDLGGGKTTFLQGFAKGLGIKQRITSPTFIIMKKFKIQSPKFRIQNLYHIDCYRAEKPKEILDLGFKKIVSSPKNIIIIEWADRIHKILPTGTTILKFEFIDQTTRKITVGSLRLEILNSKVFQGRM